MDLGAEKSYEIDSLTRSLIRFVSLNCFPWSNIPKQILT